MLFHPDVNTVKHNFYWQYWFNAECTRLHTWQPALNIYIFVFAFLCVLWTRDYLLYKMNAFCRYVGMTRQATFFKNGNFASQVRDYVNGRNVQNILRDWFLKQECDVFFFSVCVGRSSRLPEARASSAFNQAPRADAALSDFIYTQLNYVSDVYFNLFSHD